MNRMHSFEEIKKNHLEMRKSTSLEFITNSLTHMEYLIGILKCPICSNQVKQAHMCPTCCKLYCELCIKNWIVYQKPECPHCLKPLRYTSPINCQGLAKQIEQAIAKTASQISSQPKQIQSPYQSKILSGTFSTPDFHTQESRISVNSVNSQIFNLCTEHELKMEYYCETCLLGVCSDCAVLSNKHQGHKLCKYSLKRTKFQQKINQIKKQISAKKKQIAKKREQKTQLLENKNRIEQQKRQLICSYIKRTNQSIINKLNFTIDRKVQGYGLTRQKIQDLMSQLVRSEKKLQNSNRVSLVKNCPKDQALRLRSLQGQLTKLTKNIKRQNFQNQFIPSFGSKTFILDNYTYLKQKGDLLYSEPLFWKGIQWKLRIFPGGMEDSISNKKDNEKFLAIYLEMSRGHKQPNIYKYEILLINQVDRTKAIGCAFQNQFQQGTYWGLDKFANISFLQSEKFIHPLHGYLQIVLNVKSPTFYHAVKDKDFLISQRIARFNQNQNNLKILRKRAGGKALSRQKNAQISMAIEALIQIRGQKKSNVKRNKSI